MLADGDKTKGQLLGELEGMRRRIAELEASEAARKQVEEKLRFTSEIVNNMSEGVVLTPVDNLLIVYTNPRFEKIFGYGRGELIGKHVTILNSPSEWPPEGTAKEIIKHLERDGVWRGEVNNIKKDGTSFWCQANITTFQHPIYGQVYVNVLEDITERKQAEEALLRNEANLAEAQQIAKLGSWEIDLKTNERQWSDALYSIIGLEPQKLPPSHELFVSRVHPDDRGSLEEKYQAALNGHEPYNDEFRIILPDSSVRTIRTEGKLIRDQSGHLDKFIGTAQDITESKQAEEALRLERDKLVNIFNSMEDPVHICNSEYDIEYANPAFLKTFGPIEGRKCYQYFRNLEEPCSFCKTEDVLSGGTFHEEVTMPKNQRTYDQLDTPLNNADGSVSKLEILRDITEHKQAEEELLKIEKLESLGMLAGGIAHDFNNLLTGIMGNISLAKRHVEPKSKAEDRLLEAEKASIRAKDLTRQLLTFSRGGVPIRETASIVELLEDSASFVLRGSNVRGEFSLPDDLWAIEIDKGQMSQVISNLTINADEAMPGGGVLQIRAKNTVVGARSTLPLPKGNYVKITVEDHGSGIPEEHLGKIFDPYFTTKQKGSGLGLTTAYSIVRKHDGHITVESKPGVGTTYHVYLPTSKKTVSVMKEAVEETTVRGRGRILVMDDEEMIQEMLSSMLQETGYEVAVTGDGAEAIDQYVKAKESRRPFSAVILDLTVPGGMGGKEVIKKLLEIDPQTKVIVSSGYSTDPIMADFKKYGFSAVITKPYSVEALEKVLRDLTMPKKK